MHRDNELGQYQAAPLFSVSELPYTAKNLIRQLRFLENSLSRAARQNAILQVLIFEDCGIL
jgi:hypothetical protein